ncbi:MAG: hypothetical protein AAF357_03660 [Verrucomicrobiota bacterium]
MELKDIRDILSFSAFRPEPDNPRFAWNQRFPKRRSVFVNLSRGRVSWAMLGKNGRVEDVGDMDGEFAEVAEQMGEVWRANSEDGWIGLSLNNRFIITLEHNLSRKKGWEEELRRNPKTVLGSKYDRTKRYAIQHNPETSASIVMACDESIIRSLEESMRNYNLRAARICCGLFGMTGGLLDQVAKDNTLKKQDLVLITWLDGSICVLRQHNGQWQDLRCRSGLGQDDKTAVSQILSPFLESAQPNTRVLLLEDGRDPSFAKEYRSLLGQLQVIDHSTENQLWELMAKA